MKEITGQTLVAAGNSHHTNGRPARMPDPFDTELGAMIRRQLELLGEDRSATVCAGLRSGS